MFYFIFSSLSFLFAFDVGGLGFEFCVFVAGWEHPLRSEWIFAIIIIIGVAWCQVLVWQFGETILVCNSGGVGGSNKSTYHIFRQGNML